MEQIKAIHWNDLPLETQKRLQQAKSKLSEEDKRLRKKLFHGSGWIDAWGHKQKFQISRDEKKVKTLQEVQEDETKA